LSGVLLWVRIQVCCDPIVLFYLAGLAAFWVVLQPLVGKKELFARAEDKFNATLDTSQDFIVVLVHVGLPCAADARCDLGDSRIASMLSWLW
jgi:hypothetical protein